MNQKIYIYILVNISIYITINSNQSIIAKNNKNLDKLGDKIFIIQ